jgi:type IV conjugative transfer system protein TraL
MESRVPRTVDRPPLFLNWEADEVGPALVGLIMGIITKAYILIFMGIAATKIIVTAREKGMEALITHWAYKKGIFTSRSKKLTPGHITRFYQ